MTDTAKFSPLPVALQGWLQQQLHLLINEEYGSDIAVRALPGSAHIRIAPLHFMLKQWELNEA